MITKMAALACPLLTAGQQIVPTETYLGSTGHVQVDMPLMTTPDHHKSLISVFAQLGFSTNSCRTSGWGVLFEPWTPSVGLWEEPGQKIIGNSAKL